MKIKKFSLTFYCLVPNEEEVTEGWRKFQNENHHNLYSSPNISLLN
jgi:hypothetical protein